VRDRAASRRSLSVQAAAPCEPKPQYRQCPVCGFVRADAPSAYPACCGKPMDIIDEGAKWPPAKDKKGMTVQRWH